MRAAGDPALAPSCKVAQSHRVAPKTRAATLGGQPVKTAKCDMAATIAEKRIRSRSKRKGSTVRDLGRDEADVVDEMLALGKNQGIGEDAIEDRTERVVDSPLKER